MINLLRSSVFQKILKSATIYAGGNFINIAMPFLLVPILTRFLTPENYGTLATFVAIFGIVQTIIYMGTTDAVVRSYLERGTHNFEFSAYVFSAVFINFSVFFIIMVAWYLLKSYLVRAIPLPFNYQLLIPLVGLFISIYMLPSKLLVMMKKPLPYTLLNTSGALVEFALSVFLVVIAGLSWKGRIAGIVLAKFLLFVVAIGILIKYRFIKISLNPAYLKSILRYGFPVVLHSLGFVVIAGIDKFFLNKFISLSTTGIYSVSYSICLIIAFFTGAFNLALTPFIYEKLNSPTEAFKKKLVNYTYLYFVLVFLGVALFINFVPWTLNFLLGKQFLGAGRFIFWLALGFGFYSMYTIVSAYIFYEKKTYILSFIAVVTIVLAVIFNYTLIRLNGAIGAAQATCLVFLSRFVLVWYFSNRVYPMPWFSLK